MPPYLSEKIAEASPSGQLERETVAGKVFDFLAGAIGAGPYETAAYIKTGRADSCILAVQTAPSAANERETIITVQVYFKVGDGRFRHEQLIQVYSKNVYESGGRKLNLRQTTELLAELESFSDEHGEINYASPEDLDYIRRPFKTQLSD